MKRKLNEEEEELIKKGIIRNGEALKELREQLAYNMAVIEHQKTQRIFEDKWRYYLRKQKDKQDNEIIRQFESDIKEKMSLIEMNKKQIKDGVETQGG